MTARSRNSGDWSASPTFSYWKTPLVELDGKALAVVGLGTIGRRVAAVCTAMEMHAIAANFEGRDAVDIPYPRGPIDEAFAAANVRFFLAGAPMNVVNG